MMKARAPQTPGGNGEAIHWWPQRPLNKFQGHSAAWLFPLGFIDHSHATLAKLPENAVSADRGGHRAHCQRRFKREPLRAVWSGASCLASVCGHTSALAA
jgi:hypothetical protein